MLMDAEGKSLLALGHRSTSRPARQSPKSAAEPTWPAKSTVTEVECDGPRHEKPCHEKQRRRQQLAPIDSSIKGCCISELAGIGLADILLTRLLSSFQRHFGIAEELFQTLARQIGGYAYADPFCQAVFA